jgi:hypothetical protein
VKTIRRCDGTEDFRPLTGATALKMKESPFNNRTIFRPRRGAWLRQVCLGLGIMRPTGRFCLAIGLLRMDS